MPLTVEIIMCLTLNSTLECALSIDHVVATADCLFVFVVELIQVTPVVCFRHARRVADVVTRRILAGKYSVYGQNLLVTCPNGLRLAPSGRRRLF
jgi:hypothetical protein